MSFRSVRGIQKASLTCQAAAQSMRAGGRPGKIVTISSGAYASARPGASHYCASKAGVVMFTKTLAMELAEARINVNCIAPGLHSSLTARSPDSEFRRALLKNIPWGRFGTPADVAEIALFLVVIRGRLRDRRGVRGQWRCFFRAYVSAARYRDGAMTCGNEGIRHDGPHARSQFGDGRG